MTRRLALLRLAVLGGALVTFVGVLVLSGSISADRVRDWVEGYGAAGPLVFIAISAALGTPVSIASATLGATIAFSLSRWWGHDAVVAVAGPRLQALRGWVGRRGFLTVLYARIAPGVPYTLVNYAAGLTRIPLAVFAAATALGAAPRAFAYTALGGSLGNLRSPEAYVAIAVLVVMAVGGLVLARRDLARSRIQQTREA